MGWACTCHPSSPGWTEIAADRASFTSRVHTRRGKYCSTSSHKQKIVLTYVCRAQTSPLITQTSYRFGRRGSQGSQLHPTAQHQRHLPAPDLPLSPRRPWTLSRRTTWRTTTLHLQRRSNSCCTTLGNSLTKLLKKKHFIPRLNDTPRPARPT